MISVIFVLELLTPCTLPMFLGAPFLISIKLITYQKKKKLCKEDYATIANQHRRVRDVKEGDKVLGI